MQTKNPLRNICVGLSTAALVAACATSSPPRESGFLHDYSRLREVPAPGGGTRQAYLNPKFTPAGYQAVWLDPVVYYPEPKPTADVSMQTLTQIRQAVDRSLREKFGQQVRLVDKAGPGVAHVRVAITAVGTETQALKAYQYIPVALVMTGAKAALQGGMPRDATIAIETEVTDSVSGELLYAAVRGGTGERVASANQDRGGIQPGSLRPLIDEWTTNATREIRKYVQGK